VHHNWRWVFVHAIQNESSAKSVMFKETTLLHSKELYLPRELDRRYSLFRLETKDSASGVITALWASSPLLEHLDAKGRCILTY
jgi:hypothetical protein